MVEGSPHKPFDLELETERLEAEMLRAERFTPPDKLGIFDMPGVHKALSADSYSLRLKSRLDKPCFTADFSLP